MLLKLFQENIEKEIQFPFLHRSSGAMTHVNGNMTPANMPETSIQYDKRKKQTNNYFLYAFQFILQLCFCSFNKLK